MTETSLNTPRTWVEFVDPASSDDEQQVFRCDLTWLTSSWTCVYGRGCRGIDLDRPDAGCCTHGAHFTEDADHHNVAGHVAVLDPGSWQRHPDVTGLDGWTEQEDGATKTRVVDGACVFHNDSGFAGGAGCALHHLAARLGVPRHTTKPEVCWQLPIRRSYRTVERADGTSYLETTIGEYDRRAWGPGGHDLAWYCSSSPQAHVGDRPVYVGYADELRELLGDASYDELAQHCEAHLRAVDLMRAQHGASARRLLPLLVHPATLAADNG
ncbi:MAG: hypothetical protein ACRC35_10510 [Angustibacter sp.]